MSYLCLSVDVNYFGGYEIMEMMMRAIAAHFANGLGNFLMMMPALQAIASMAESKKIDLVLPDEWNDYRKELIEDIAEAWPVINRVIHYPRENVKEEDYDGWYWTAHGSSGQALQLFLRNMKHRAVARPAWRASLIHESDHYMEIAHALGYKGPVPVVEFPIAQYPVLNGIERPVIALCNGAFKTQEWEKKHWPHFPKLAKTLKLYFGGTIIGVGRQNELHDVPLSIDYTGRLKIIEVATVLKQVDLFITTDTGLMHLADLMNIPMITLFGPTLTSKNAPRSKQAVVLQSGLPCAPCQDTTRFYNCQHYACMENISVGDVIASAKDKLRWRIER